MRKVCGSGYRARPYGVHHPARQRGWCGIEHRFYHGFYLYLLFQRKLFADITVHAQIVSDPAFALTTGVTVTSARYKEPSLRLLIDDRSTVDAEIIDATSPDNAISGLLAGQNIVVSILQLTALIAGGTTKAVLQYRMLLSDR